MMTFYVDNPKDKATSAWLRLPPEHAVHLLVALGYEARDVAFFRDLDPDELLSQIARVLRQFDLGHGCEFTTAGFDEKWLQHELIELRKVAERAEQAGTTVLLFQT